MKKCQYTSLIETTLFQCRSYKRWRHINIDKTMFQPCMAADAYSGEFVLRFCLLGAFHFFIYIKLYLLKEALLKHLNKKSSFISHISLWFKTKNIDGYSKTHLILERRTM